MAPGYCAIMIYLAPSFHHLCAQCSAALPAGQRMTIAIYREAHLLHRPIRNPQSAIRDPNSSLIPDTRHLTPASPASIQRVVHRREHLLDAPCSS
jgi:hypothetical protein